MFRPDRGDTNAVRREHREVLERAVHDLKNPLAVVRASLEWLATELRGSRIDAEDALRDAASAVAKLVTVTDDLHLVARLDTDPLTSHRRVLAADLLSAARVACSVRATSRGLTLTSFAPGELALDCDAELVGRSLEILVDSALRGAPPRSEIRIDARPFGEGVELHVGPPHAARAFTRATPEAPGLGAYLARRVVEKHGGELLVSADLPACVVLRFPRRA